MSHHSKRLPDRNTGQDLFFEVLFSIYLVGIVLFFWHLPLWAALLLGVGLALQLWFWGERADGAAMAGAALLGTPSEILCVRYGVWTYEAPGLLFGIPVWLPLIWGSLFCLFRRISLTIHDLIQGICPDARAVGKRVFFALLAAFIIGYCVLVLFTIDRTIAAVYSFFMFLAVIFWHSQRDILIFIVAGFLGTLGEYICMKVGFWEYQYPFFRSIGLPISLPMAWGLSGVIIGRIARIWEKETTKILIGAEEEQT